MHRTLREITCRWTNRRLVLSASRARFRLMIACRIEIRAGFANLDCYYSYCYFSKSYCIVISKWFFFFFFYVLTEYDRQWSIKRANSRSIRCYYCSSGWIFITFSIRYILSIGDLWNWPAYYQLFLVGRVPAAIGAPLVARFPLKSNSWQLSGNHGFAVSIRGIILRSYSLRCAFDEIVASRIGEICSMIQICEIDTPITGCNFGSTFNSGPTKRFLFHGNLLNYSNLTNYRGRLNRACLIVVACKTVTICVFS